MNKSVFLLGFVVRAFVASSSMNMADGVVGGYSLTPAEKDTLNKTVNLVGECKKIFIKRYRSEGSDLAFDMLQEIEVFLPILRRESQGE